MSTIRLFSAPSCPFAQRTRLLLSEKGLAYEMEIIDLKDTPDWYYEISPAGKVPCLQHNDSTILESAVINEYLEEVFADTPLLPMNASERASGRYVIARTDQALIPAFYRLLLEQDTHAWARRTDALSQALMELDGLIQGDWFLGDNFSLADLTVYPFLERFGMLQHYRQAQMPTEAVRLQAWLARMQTRDSVRGLQQSTDFYIEVYSHYADGSANGVTAKEMSD